MNKIIEKFSLFSDSEVEELYSDVANLKDNESIEKSDCLITKKGDTFNVKDLESGEEANLEIDEEDDLVLSEKENTSEDSDKTFSIKRDLVGKYFRINPVPYGFLYCEITKVDKDEIFARGYKVEKSNFFTNYSSFSEKEISIFYPHKTTEISKKEFQEVEEEYLKSQGKSFTESELGLYSDKSDLVGKYYVKKRNRYDHNYYKITRVDGTKVFARGYYVEGSRVITYSSFKGKDITSEINGLKEISEKEFNKIEEEYNEYSKSNPAKEHDYEDLGKVKEGQCVGIQVDRYTYMYCKVVKREGDKVLADGVSVRRGGPGTDIKPFKNKDISSYISKGNFEGISQKEFEEEFNSAVSSGKSFSDSKQGVEDKLDKVVTALESLTEKLTELLGSTEKPKTSSDSEDSKELKEPKESSIKVGDSKYLVKGEVAVEVKVSNVDKLNEGLVQVEAPDGSQEVKVEDLKDEKPKNFSNLEVNIKSGDLVSASVFGKTISGKVISISDGKVKVDTSNISDAPDYIELPLDKVGKPLESEVEVPEPKTFAKDKKSFLEKSFTPPKRTSPKEFDEEYNPLEDSDEEEVDDKRFIDPDQEKVKVFSDSSKGLSRIAKLLTQKLN